MAAPNDDENVPLEYWASSGTGRASKNLQDIGIGRFKRQGVAQHFHPNSAAGILNRQAAEQRMDAWLRRAPVDAKGKKKAKKAAKSKKSEATSTTTKDAGEEVTKGPAVAVAKMGQDKAAVEHVKTLYEIQGQAGMVAKAPTRKAVKVVTVPRYVKPTQGAWGQRAAENAKKAALKAATPSYSPTPITIGLTDGEPSATVTPTPKLPTPEPIIPRAAPAKPKSVSTQSASIKTVRKPATKSRAAKKSPSPIAWGDSDDGDQDDAVDSLFSSRNATPSTKTTRTRTTKNSSTSRNSNLRRNLTRDQPTPQKKRQVRFEPSQSPEEEADTTTNPKTTAQQESKPASQKKKRQQQQQPTHLLPTPFSTFSLPKQTSTSHLNPNKPLQTQPSSPTTKTPNSSRRKKLQALSRRNQQPHPPTPIPTQNQLLLHPRPQHQPRSPQRRSRTSVFAEKA